MDVQKKDDEFQEKEWIALAKSGDEAGWAELHRNYYKGLWSAVNQLVQDPALAEDIVQDAFLKAYRKIDTFKEQSKFSTWIYRIAMNQAYDVLRKLGRQKQKLGLFPLQEDEEKNPHEAIDTHDGSKEAHLTDQKAIIKAALDTLPPDHRAVVDLRLVQGFSTEETAKILKCKRGTVLSRLFYSCQKLKKHLETKYDEF